MKTITMYLPQFHQVVENDAWWGEGFTEWTAVKAAVPLFDGHNQPRIPLNRNYYNLLEKDTMIWQADLMNRYGVDGQCIYHYYFKDGRKILEKPAENLLKWRDIPMPFCFCWANGSWARTWSNLGGNSWADKFETTNNMNEGTGILLEQKYGREKEWKAHFEYLLPFFIDKRYIKINGKPIFLIYEPVSISCILQMIDYWNELACSEGLPGIYFIGMNVLKAIKGLDAILLNAPHMFWDSKETRRINNVRLPEYQEVWNHIIRAPEIEGIKTYFGGVSDCDDSPRRGSDGIAFSDFSVDIFRSGMIDLYRKSMQLNNEFVFINAWNEWGEGMYLEPDERNGYGCLEAIKTAREVFQYNNSARFCFDAKPEKKGDLKIKDELELQKKITRCLNQWMIIKEEGKSIGNYLLNQGIHTVAIYGMGMMGKHLLIELENSTVEICYVIDQRTELHHPKYVIKSPEDDLQEVDAVIITPIKGSENIYEVLRNKIQTNFYFIYELLCEC